MNRKVVITGLGCVSGLGMGVDANWSRLARGESAIRPLERPPLEGMAAWLDPEELVAPLATIEPRRFGKLDPLSRFALAAAIEATDQAGLRDHPSLATRTAIVIGCGSPGNTTLDAAYQRLYGQQAARLHPQTIPSSMISAPASHVAMLLGVHGPTMVVSSACASSASALGEAMHMIRSGRVDVAVAGGTEACLSYGPWMAWQALGVVAPDSCRPFSRDRKGLVLGEGGAMLVLESEDHASTRGAVILGELIGYGASSDASDMTAPDQAGVEAAIRAAHQDAALPFDAPVLISAHGTGTRLNDATEAAAMRAVYGPALGQSTVIATKSAHGHLIGGSGALEFVVGMKALAEGLAPPVLGWLGPDPDCDLPLALEPTPIAHDILVSNSFAFGGLNAVLIGRKRL